MTHSTVRVLQTTGPHSNPSTPLVLHNVTTDQLQQWKDDLVIEWNGMQFPYSNILQIEPGPATPDPS